MVTVERDGIPSHWCAFTYGILMFNCTLVVNLRQSSVLFIVVSSTTTVVPSLSRSPVHPLVRQRYIYNFGLCYTCGRMMLLSRRISSHSVVGPTKFRAVKKPKARIAIAQLCSVVFLQERRSGSWFFILVLRTSSCERVYGYAYVPPFFM